jgi:ATP-dependent helicase/nuclease subunit B
MLDYTDRMVKRIGERITDGDISVSPFVNDKKDACQFCKFNGICRFDEDIPGFKIRNEGLLTSEELRERVCGGKGDADYLF